MSGMGAKQIRLFRVVPGLSGIRPLIDAFSRGGEGVATSFDDAMLPVLHRLVDKESDIEVVPFASLVRRSLEAAGEECRPLASTDQKAIAVGQASRALRDEAPLRTAARFPGIRKAVVRTLSEVGEYGVSLNHPEAHVADLHQIQEESAKLLERIGRDSHARQVAACCDVLPDPESRLERLLVFIGPTAPPLKLDWLKWCAEQGADVMVVAERHSMGADLFHSLKGLEGHLGVQALEMGTGNQLQNNLFASEDHGGPEIEVTIASASDPLSECEWAIRGCLAIDEARSCAIYVRDLNSYGPLLLASAERLGMRLHLPMRVGLLENSFARTTLELLEALAGPDVRLLDPLFKSSYLKLDGSQRNAVFAALKDARSRRGKQWEEFRSWVLATGSPFEWVQAAFAWRENSLESVASLGEWTNGLSALIKDLPWFDLLAEELGYDAERDARACAVMRATLENEAALGRLAGNPPLSFREFVASCRRIWSSADVSIPCEGGVPVVSSASALGGANVLFVLGMLEGVFPRRRSEDPILADEARLALGGLPTSSDLAAAERDEFYRVCAAASDAVTFSYPRTDDERDNIPAFYLEMLRKAVSVREVAYSRLQLAPDLYVSEADRKLAEALSGPRSDSDSGEIRSIEAAMALHPAPGEPMKPEGLRDVLECPFRFQMRHRLAIPARSRIARWVRLRRVPEWAGLAGASMENAERALRITLETELDTLAPDMPDWELQLLKSGGARLIKEWMAREQKAREIWPKSSDSVHLNVPFGSHGTRDQIKGRKLSGMVPAVSQLVSGPRVLHLYGFRVNEPEQMTPSERLYIGLWLFGIGLHPDGAALEIEGPDGRRVLVVLTRHGVRGLTSQRNNGLQIVDLSESEDDAISRQIYATSMKRLIDESLSRIERGDIKATPGEHCETCDFGELCRRSLLFSDDDSPFGEDQAIGAA
jgi:hypothetical protein